MKPFRPRARLRAVPAALTLVLCGICVSAAPLPSETDVPAADDDGAWVFDPQGFCEQWIVWRLSLGITLAKARVRHRHVPYDPNQEHNFLGNINDMREHGDVALGLVARYEILPWFAIEAANDLRADLDARNRDGVSCDGTLQLRGWRAQALVFWPEPQWIVRPYLGLGVEHVDASFKHSPWWHYGWSSPEEYERDGNGSRSPHNGVMRTMDVKSPGFAPAISLGATVGLYRHAQLDAFVRWTDFDDAETTFRRREGRREHTMLTGAFPAEHIVCGIALSVVF